MNQEQFEKIYQDCKAEAASGNATLEDEAIIFAKARIDELEHRLKHPLSYREGMLAADPMYTIARLRDRIADLEEENAAMAAKESKK